MPSVTHTPGFEKKQSRRIDWSAGPGGAVYRVIDWIRDTAKSEKDKGAKFERASRYYLKNDPLYAARFTDVWLWKDAPTNNGADIGIDLVAQDAVDGSYWAIQCKCYDEGATLDYKTVSTFFGAQGARDTYAHNMLISTTENLTPNLDKALGEWDTVRLFPAEMDRAHIDWKPFIEGKQVAERNLYEPRPHQERAIADCIKGFGESDRGKLVMACGTGKTLTSLRLAERLVGAGGSVLFCAPSIALVGQSMRSWVNQSKLPMKVAVVCSDEKASDVDGDTWDTSLKDLPYPATTDPDLLFAQIEGKTAEDGLTVIFSTYQSIQVVADAQKQGLGAFDLIVCDEAHRTTGAKESGASTGDISQFVKVHDNNIVAAEKRLYMTATPRIFGDKVKSRALADDYIVASMDDESVYGPEFHRLSFGQAVDAGLLTDYRVIALTVSEELVSEVFQRVMHEDEKFEIPDAAKVIGCWKGMLNQGAVTDVGGVIGFVDAEAAPVGEGRPLQNAVAFCSTIRESKRIAENFGATVDAYLEYERETKGERLPELACKVHHVDGSMNARQRRDELDWLSASIEKPQECRVLSNARCLSEGVDVPSLDAVMFLQPKRSQVEITQAVGRVMRKFEGKRLGYIILPVVIPSGMRAEEALDDNEAYAAVWQVLKGLRSHDERMDAKINALPYDRADAMRGESEKRDDGAAGESASGAPFQGTIFSQQFQEGVRAVIVKKCGTKIYWDLWARDIAQIARRHIERIGAIVRNEPAVRGRFATFLQGLRDSLNESVTQDQAVEMLAQHVITLPVFEALFGGGFSKSNPVSIAMEDMIEALRGFELETPEERRELEELYRSVGMRAEGVRTGAGRQQIIKDLYENFFRHAFKATSEAMGVVYTPRQVVRYILHFTNRILQKEFGQTFADKDVHILDPFTGTGTFIVDLIEDEGLIPTEALPYKYAKEIHCNEILLLAYYIATINIETAYHNRMRAGLGSGQSGDGDAGHSPMLKQSCSHGSATGASGSCGTALGKGPASPAGDVLELGYEPFAGAVLTDTFQMYEEGDPIDREVFGGNTQRVLSQMEVPVKVIVGNPPYSAGQNSANDNNANEKYPTLDARIERTYAANTKTQNKNSLYDSYIRAFRWASDRIGDRGIITFVSNAGWVRSEAASGMRKCLRDEFNSIYVFDLRGNQRTQGEQSRKEGGKIFGSGSRAPIAITTLVKNPDSDERGVIRYHDIGDYLTREDKLSIVASWIDGVTFDWGVIEPDRHNDWLDQRDDSFYDFAPLGLAKFKQPHGVFQIWSAGIKTQRDSWCWNYSAGKVQENVGRLITESNDAITAAGGDEKAVEYDATRYSWTRAMLNRVKNNRPLDPDAAHVVLGAYRPFCKQWLCYDAELNERTYQQPRLFPLRQATGKGREDIPATQTILLDKEKAGRDDIPATSLSPMPNLVICTSERGVIITNVLPDLEIMHHGQCFPLYWYEDGIGDAKHRRDAITDEALEVFRAAYPNEYAARPKTKGGPGVSKQDIFYYIYGVLHSPEYRSRFAANLKKELPRIPLVRDFVAFAEAGRALADLHLNYEAVEMYPLEIVGDEKKAGPVVKMKWGKKTDPATGKKVPDHSVLIYNENLTFKGIPAAAERYVVNGRTPLEWMVDRYQVRCDKASGIVNDPNGYSDDALYIVNLAKRLVTVSVRTTEIVDALPAISELPQTANWPFAWKRAQ